MWIQIYFCHFFKYSCFNRYMVECEFGKQRWKYMLWKRFNRYMVECESLSVLKSAQTVTAVLIDTWWNVNMEHYNEYIFQYQVLIDTWWNVNVCIGMIQSYGSNCFNRYMVECEWSLWSNVTEVVFVLIDTWWNVNDFDSGIRGFNPQF